MSTALIEQVAQALQTQLETIEVGGSTLSVTRPPAHGIELEGQHEILLVQGDRKLVEARPDSMQAWEQEFNIALVCNPSWKVMTAMDTYINQFSVAVEVALADHRDFLPECVTDADLGGPAPLPADSPHKGAAMIYTVTYRHLIGQPYGD